MAAALNCRPSGSLDYFALLDGPPLSSWRSREEPVQSCILPFMRIDCAIKIWDQTPNSRQRMTICLA